MFQAQQAVKIDEVAKTCEEVMKGSQGAAELEGAVVQTQGVINTLRETSDPEVQPLEALVLKIQEAVELEQATNEAAMEVEFLSKMEAAAMDREAAAEAARAVRDKLLEKGLKDEAALVDAWLNLLVSDSATGAELDTASTECRALAKVVNDKASCPPSPPRDPHDVAPLRRIFSHAVPPCGPTL